MTFFVDANVVIYAWVPGQYHGACGEILTAIAAGDADGRTSTSALEEVWHLESTGRAGDITGLTERAYRALAPLLPVTDDAFAAALGLEAPRLDPLDRLHVGTCLVNDIGVIVSADRGFDGVKGIRRVDPLDPRARRKLLGSAR